MNKCGSVSRRRCHSSATWISRQGECRSRLPNYDEELASPCERVGGGLAQNHSLARYAGGGLPPSRAMVHSRSSAWVLLGPCSCVQFAVPTPVSTSDYRWAGHEGALTLASTPKPR
mgnify:CR=1 FL=1